jgi:hypothetical protein
MKNISKSASLPTKDQSKVNSKKDRHQKTWRQIKLQLAAVFLVIVFLASECATLLPVE